MAVKTLFIGAGAMGGAILRGAINRGLLDPTQVHVTEHRDDTCESLHDELGVTATMSIPDLKDVELIVFAVKPQVLPTVLEAVRNKGISSKTMLVSIAAGITLESLKEALPSEHWYRAMPNIPLLVDAGYTALASGGGEVPEFVVSIFKSLGDAFVVSEADLDRMGVAVGAAVGYAFTIIDALADGGVRIGLPRQLAIQCAAQALYGAGKIVIESGEHPAALRDKVTSPGGTTIAGICAFEKHGGRTALQEALVASYERSNELGRKK